MRILGIVISLIVALAYYFVWPGWKNPESTRNRSLSSKFILRWFHFFTWVLLAAACFFRMKVLAVLSGGVYLIFLFALAREQSSVRQR